MTLGSLSGGVASDWLAHHYSARIGRCWLPAVAQAFTAVLLVVGSHVARAQTASLVLACGAGALYVSQSCFWSVTADFAGEHAGVASGMMNMGAQVGGAVTASLTPLIALHFGWNASFLTAALLAAGGTIAWLTVDPDKRLAALEESPTGVPSRATAL
jgi:MFS transporter, ACS family, glucarate transporter